MTKSFDDEFITIANDMGIALYTRFELKEASLFLRTTETNYKISFFTVKLITLNQTK
jgi:hypothetical protein